MLKKPQGKCSNLNPALLVCTTEKCHKDALMCSVEDCGCKSHQDCLNTAPVANLINKIMVKDQSGRKYFQRAIDCCDMGIKLLEIQKQTFQKYMDVGGKLLDDNEQKVLDTLKSQTKKQVTGNTLAKVVQSVTRNPKIESIQLQKRFKDGIERFEEHIKKGLKDLQRNLLGESPTQQEIGSTKGSCKSNFKIEQISKNMDVVIQGKSIKSHNNRIKFAVLNPDLGSLGQKEVTVGFKVVNMYYVWIGVVFKQVLEKSLYEGRNSGSEGLLVNMNGTESPKFDPWRKENNFKGFKNRDVIHLCYSGKKKTLTFLNISEGKSLTLDVSQFLKRQLCFGVSLNAGASAAEVEYLGVI